MASKFSPDAQSSYIYIYGSAMFVVVARDEDDIIATPDTFWRSWYALKFQLSTLQIATFNIANRNFQHYKSQLSTLQIATFNITNHNFQHYNSQLSTLQIATFNIANRNFQYCKWQLSRLQITTYLLVSRMKVDFSPIHTRCSLLRFSKLDVDSSEHESCHTMLNVVT